MGHHLIVLVADTLRGPESFPPGGFERAAPFLTALAAAGWTLPKFVASSSWTYPSHLALLHGLEPWQVPSRDPEDPPPLPATLAEVARERGMESAAFSRNPLVARSTGVLRGYGEVHPSALTLRSGLAARLNCMWDPVVSWSAGRSTDRRPGGHGRATAEVARAVGSGLARFARASYASLALLPKLRGYLRDRDRREGAHLFVNLMEAHEPYLSPRTGPLGPVSTGLPPSSNLAYHAATGAIPARSAPRLADLYLEALGELDRRLGTVFALLRRAGILEDATVVVVSDHGQALGEHGFVGHGRHLFDELVRVPCIIWSSPGAPELSVARAQFSDHRHLHEVLRRSLETAAPPSDRDWEEAFRLRGPAYAHARWRDFEGRNPLRRAQLHEVWRRFPLDRQPTRSVERSGPSIDVEGERARRIQQPGIGLAEGEPWQETELGEVAAVASPALPLDSWGYGE